MNTRIYVKNPNGKNYGLSLELRGGFHSKLAKRNKAHPTTQTSIVHSSHTHPPSTNSMPEPSSSKKDKRSSTQILPISQERTSGSHFSTKIKNSKVFRKLLAFPQQGACLFIELSEPTKSSSFLPTFMHVQEILGIHKTTLKVTNPLKFSM